jgi:hypothetical protein
LLPPPAARFRSHSPNWMSGKPGAREDPLVDIEGVHRIPSGSPCVQGKQKFNITIKIMMPITCA